METTNRMNVKQPMEGKMPETPLIIRLGARTPNAHKKESHEAKITAHDPLPFVTEIDAGIWKHPGTYATEVHRETTDDN